MYTVEEIKAMPLEERLKILELRAKLQKKKAKVVGSIQRIAKNGWNDFHKYEYSTESDIKEGVRSLLSEAGLTLDVELISDEKEEVQTRQGKAWLHTVTMEFILTDNDTGYMDVKRSKGVATDTGDKGLYKAYSGCIKYYLINNFLISTGEKENDPEYGDSEQVFEEPKAAKGSSGKGSQTKSGSSGNKKTQTKQQKPKASISSIEAKWKVLNNGSLEGLKEYIAKKQAEGKDLDWIDQILLGKIQAKQAEKAKQAEQAKKAEDQAPAQKPDKQGEPEELKEIQEESAQNTMTVTDVSTGKTVEYNGKEVFFE